jgi:hypothetical protein
MVNFSAPLLNWLEKLLLERFGYSFLLTMEEGGLRVCHSGSSGSVFFDRLQNAFHTSRTDFTCEPWDASGEGYSGVIDTNIPAPTEDRLAHPLIEINQRAAIIHYDILGLTYWMLSRLEEVGSEDLDDHQRFSAISSHAYRHGYLERPIVDEWLDVLAQVMVRVWPELKLKKHEFNVKVSHDVDTPSLYAFQPWKVILRMMASHLVKRLDLKALFQAFLVKLTTKKALKKEDPYNTFDWLMDVSEANGINSAFYFICGCTDPKMDADYELGHPLIRGLIKHISRRGHEVGLHPSYNSFQSSGVVKHEIANLKRICAEEGVSQKAWGGRMHYLRWQQPETMQILNDVGMHYDSTLGYADHPGFRCGTCFEYTAFNSVSQRELKLRIRPLVVMECTVVGDTYLGLGVTKDAERKMTTLKRNCRLVNGSFTLLWHNSYFNNQGLKTLYTSVLDF